MAAPRKAYEDEEAAAAAVTSISARSECGPRSTFCYIELVVIPILEEKYVGSPLDLQACHCGSCCHHFPGVAEEGGEADGAQPGG